MYLNYVKMDFLVELENAINQEGITQEARISNANAIAERIGSLFGNDIGLVIKITGEGSCGVGYDFEIDGHTFTSMTLLVSYLGHPKNAIMFYRKEAQVVLQKFINKNELFCIDNTIESGDVMRINEFLNESENIRPLVRQSLSDTNNRIMKILHKVATASQQITYIAEACPYCEFEVGLDEIGRAICPVCNKMIATCSICDKERCDLCNANDRINIGAGFMVDGKKLFAI